MRTDIQTDGNDEIVALCNFPNARKNSTFCPHSVFACFVWISEQTAIISLYSINWLVFITETVSVCCAVRTVQLRLILIFKWLKTGDYIKYRHSQKLVAYRSKSTKPLEQKIFLTPLLRTVVYLHTSHLTHLSNRTYVLSSSVTFWSWFLGHAIFLRKVGPRPSMEVFVPIVSRLCVSVLCVW